MTLTKRNFLASVGLGGISTLLAGCNTLSLFSAMTPKDSHVRRVARSIAYGEGPRKTYDVYAPAKTSGPLPVLVFFYGGGWNSGSKEDYVWFGYALASMGYVVAVPDYRVVPEVVYPDFLTDSADAVKHIIAHASDYGGDSKRLGLAGHSAGAYNAVMLALDDRYLGHDAAGKSPVTACLGISGPYDFYPFDVSESINAFSKWAKPEETQPIDLVHPTNTHFMLMQSRPDKIVGIHNAVNLAAKLKASGDDVELKIYEGLSHQDTAAAFSVPFRGKGSLFADARTWLNKTL